MAGGSAVFLDVLPSMAKFGTNLTKNAAVQATKAGRTAGQRFSQAMNAGAASSASGAASAVAQLEQSAKRATRAIETEKARIYQARQAEVAAAKQVEAAEATLAAQRTKHGAASAQALKAESSLATARGRTQVLATRTTSIEDQLRAAYSEQTVVAKQLAAAQNTTARSTGSLGRNFGALAAAGEPLAAGMGRAAGGIKRVAGEALGVVKPLAGMAAGFGAIVGISRVVDLGVSYTKTMNELGAVTNSTAAQMQFASTTARALGSDLTLPATSGADAAAIMVELAKGGLTLQGSMDAAKGTIQLAAAAQIDGATAAEVQANALNQFGLAAKDAGLVADVLANTANAAAGGVTDIATSLKYVGPVARSLGIDITDTASAIGLLANQGLKGDTAGTALRGMLASLAAPSEAAGGAMDRLGITAFDASGRFVGMRSIIEQLTEAQKTMTQEQFASNAAVAFGREPLAAITALASEGAGSFDNMAKAVGRQGGAAAVAQSQMKGLGGAMDKLESQLEDVALGIYTTVTPALEAAVNGIAGGLDGAGSKVQEFLDIAGGLGRLAFTGQVSGDLTAATNLVPESPQVQAILQARTIVVDALADIRTFVTTALVPSLRDAAVAVTPLAVILAGAFLGALRAAAFVLANVIGPALVGVTGFLRDNQGVVIAAAGAIGLLVAAYKAQAAAAVVAEAGGLVPWIRSTKLGTAATKAQTAALALARGGVLAWKGVIATGAAIQFTLVAATKGWTYALALQKGAALTATTSTIGLTAAQTAFNAALAANPIGLLVVAIVAVVAAIAALVAGIIWAYKNVGWFKTAVDAVWTGIKVGAKAVGDAAVWLWKSVFVPAWQGIATAAQWAWSNVLKPAFDGISGAVKFVGAAFTWWWSSVVQPVFAWIGNAARTLWDGWLSPVFELIGAIIRGTVGGAFVWLRDSVIMPVVAGIVAQFVWWRDTLSAAFNAVVGFLRDVLGAAFVWLRDSVITPVVSWITQQFITGWNTWRGIFTAVGDFLRSTFGPAFTWLRDNVIRPVWDGIKSAIKGAWEGGIKPVFDTVARFATKTIPDAFNTMKDGISKAWEAVKDAAKAPIRFVVNTVVNDALIGNFNKVADAFGTKRMQTIALPKGFAGGGVIPGYQSAKRDEVMTPMRKGEGVLVPEVVRALGSSFVHNLNAAGNTGGVGAVRSLVGYAKGGVVEGGPGSDGGGKGGALDGVINWAKGAASNVLDVLTDPMGTLGKFVRGVLGRIPGAGQMVELAGGFGRKVLDGAIEKLKSFGLLGGGGASGPNGQIPAGQLAKVPGFTGGAGVGPLGGYLKLAAARAWQMAYQASGGMLTLTEGYRSLQDQQMRYAAYRAGRGNLAATPGTSVHGFGLAADVGAGQAWLRANGPRFGWQPTGLSFAQREPWHFEYKGAPASAARGGMALGGVFDQRPSLFDEGGELQVGTHLYAKNTREPEYALPEGRLVEIVEKAQRVSDDGGDRIVVHATVGGSGNHHEDLRDVRRAVTNRRRGGRGRNSR